MEQCNSKHFPKHSCNHRTTIYLKESMSICCTQCDRVSSYGIRYEKSRDSLTRLRARVQNISWYVLHPFFVTEEGPFGAEMFCKVSCIPLDRGTRWVYPCRACHMGHHNIHPSYVCLGLSNTNMQNEQHVNTYVCMYLRAVKLRIRTYTVPLVWWDTYYNLQSQSHQPWILLWGISNGGPFLPATGR